MDEEWMSNGGPKWARENNRRQSMKIYAAINAIQGELARDGITKNRRNQQQGYNFRGIDDVYNALSPLLAKHGVCILPRILARECVERTTAKGGALFYVTVEAEFDFVCAEDGSTHTVRTFGEAMDSADKATNKAMSAAYKYAAFQAFAIPTEGDNDADAHTHEVAPKSKVTPTAGARENLTPERLAIVEQTANQAITLLAQDKDFDAYSLLETSGFDTEEKIALWTYLDSKQRRRLKEQAELEKANQRKAA